MKRYRVWVMPLTASLLLVMANSGSIVMASPSPAQHHCVARVGGQDVGSMASMRCFATFSAAIRAATNGRVLLRNATKSRRVEPWELAVEGPTINYVWFTDYQYPNFGGSTFTGFNSFPCGWFDAATMPNTWNDVVSSVAVFSGCATTLYWDISFGQPNYQIHDDQQVGSLGSFDNKTSSQKVCPAFPCT